MPDGKIPKFRIQDVPPDMHDEVVQFMSDHFFRDEALCSCLNVLGDPVSLKEFQDFWKELLQQNMALVAFLEEDGGGTSTRIAGANITAISYKTDHYSYDMFKGHATRVIVRDILEYASYIVNVYDHYGVDKYMTALGLCVDRTFRGQGLGLEILKARFDLGRAVGMEVTMTAFTGPASQILAHRVGMDVLAEVMYEDFKDEDGKPVYPNIKSKSCKIMAARMK
ncbi:hypothetical protein ANN_13896 [Periplaneta americana]|uniref:N-acetyltransferase domain-containing protein n=1 Tax=Periplaneta americana TaxID=6978 RepID=A0ABQ8SWA7_PERAM|nr:hypothetical protein ANN_13896 [Periplaneta americana]